MTLLAPPNQKHPTLPPPTHRRNTWLAREGRHWMHMPLLTFALLLLISTLLLVIAPLLPFAGYALWLWAAHSWEWRVRWTSVWLWAKKGSWLVAFLIAVAVLDVAHIWFVPPFIAAAQALWQTHLPGTLSLSPLDLDAVGVRTLLVLPLAPALALCYERLDPRTDVRPRRVLTATDLVEPPPRQTSAPASSTAQTPPSVPAPASSTPKAAKTAKSQPRTPKPRSKRPSPQQITIESVLAADTTGTAQPVPPASATEMHPPDAKSINWDDVAE